MTPKEFKQYLIGAIELGGLKELNQENFSKISKKLDEIKLDSSEESTFCTWFKGFLEAVEENTLSESQFKKVEVKLNNLGKLEFPSISSTSNSGLSDIEKDKPKLRC